MPLPLPVADERHRAEDEGRSRRAGALFQQQSEKLGRLPETHVVGQAGSETECAQEREPPEPALLVGPQLADEAVGGRSGLQPPVLGTGEKIPEPSVGLDRSDGQVARGRLYPESGPDHLAGGHAVGAVAPSCPTAAMAAAMSPSRSSTH